MLSCCNGARNYLITTLPIKSQYQFFSCFKFYHDRIQSGRSKTIINESNHIKEHYSSIYTIQISRNKPSNRNLHLQHLLPRYHHSTNVIFAKQFPLNKNHRRYYVNQFIEPNKTNSGLVNEEKKSSHVLTSPAVLTPAYTSESTNSPRHISQKSGSSINSQSLHGTWQQAGIHRIDMTEALHELDLKVPWKLQSEVIKACIEEWSTNDSKSLSQQSYPESPTQISLKKPKNILFASQTGSGKTYAYALPMIQLIKDEEERSLSENPPAQQSENKKSKPPKKTNPMEIGCRPKGIILVPTRELALMTSKSLKKILHLTKLSVAPLSGGESKQFQLKDCDILIATPGAFIDKVKKHHLFLSKVRICVCDEMDIMLRKNEDGGFSEEMYQIFCNMEHRLSQKGGVNPVNYVFCGASVTPDLIQKLQSKTFWPTFNKPMNDDGFVMDNSDNLYQGSAGVIKNGRNGSIESIHEAIPVEEYRNFAISDTSDRTINNESSSYIDNADIHDSPISISKRAPSSQRSLRVIISPDVHKPPANLKQKWIEVTTDKMDQLIKILRNQFNYGGKAPKNDANNNQQNSTQVIVFCNTVDSCRFVEHALNEQGYKATCCHGNVPPKERLNNFVLFSKQQVPIMVATDLASRGLDLRDRKLHIINFDFPLNAVDYVHRIGRTARAGEPGIVSNLITKRNMPLADGIRQATAKGQSLDGITNVKLSRSRK